MTEPTWYDRWLAAVDALKARRARTALLRAQLAEAREIGKRLRHAKRLREAEQARRQR